MILSMTKKRVLSIVVVLVLSLGLFSALKTARISKANGYDIDNPRIEENGTVTWDCIYFGNYWQNDTNGDGVADQNDDKEPIKWMVLSVDGDDVFLLADKGLDAKPYDSHEGNIVWGGSILRKWLNNDFYNAAFDTHEQNVIVEMDATNETSDENNIKDKVSLLSLTDVCNASYGFNSNSSIESETRTEKPTAYADDQRAYTSSNGNGVWWLRSYPKWDRYVYYVDYLGKIDTLDTFFLNDVRYSVRPCLHLNLSSNTWTKADTVTATGGTFATPTPEPTPTPTPKPKPTPKPTATPTATPTITPKPTNPVGVATNAPIKPTETATPKPSSTPTPTPRAITAPSKPTKLSAKNSKKKSVTLSWKKVNGAAGYQIQYAANTAFAKKKLKSTKKTKLVIKNLKKKKTYSFRVRAYKISNNVKVYGNWSKVKKVKIKK